MSIDAFEDLVGKRDLYQLLAAGQADIQAGRKRPLGEAMANIRQDLAEGTL